MDSLLVKSIILERNKRFILRRENIVIVFKIFNLKILFKLCRMSFIIFKFVYKTFHLVSIIIIIRNFTKRIEII